MTRIVQTCEDNIMTPRKGTILYLTDDQRRRLDQLAMRLDRPRMRVIREAVDDLLARYERQEVARGNSPQV